MIPAEVSANNSKIESMTEDMRKFQQEQADANKATVDAAFYVNAGMKEQAQAAQDFADSFVQFVGTREHRALNALAVEKQVDIPYPDAGNDWTSFANDMKQDEAAGATSTERLGNLLDTQSVEKTDKKEV
jgi:hypothetical protein